MNMKKRTSISVGLITIAVLTLLVIVAPIKHSVSNAQTSIIAGLTLPNVPIYALTGDNAIYVLNPGTTQYSRLGRVNNTNGGNLIGIDFRPADNTPTILYGLTDTGSLYKIDVSATATFGTTTLISTTNPRYTGGPSMVMDFNPVVNALRIAGPSDQNIAVVNGANGTNLTTTVAQTNFAYVMGDPNFGKDPEISGGAYDTNRVGAASTTFYMCDRDKDTLVTIATRNATGSSNTGTGQLKTIGNFVNSVGTRLNMSPFCTFDIYTGPGGRNFLVGQTSRLLFTLDLATVNPNLPVGTTQNVVVTRGAAGIQLAAGSNSLSGPVVDIALPYKP